MSSEDLTDEEIKAKRAAELHARALAKGEENRRKKKYEEAQGRVDSQRELFDLYKDTDAYEKQTLEDNENEHRLVHQLYSGNESDYEARKFTEGLKTVRSKRKPEEGTYENLRNENGMWVYETPGKPSETRVSLEASLSSAWFKVSGGIRASEYDGGEFYVNMPELGWFMPSIGAGIKVETERKEEEDARNDLHVTPSYRFFDASANTDLDIFYFGISKDAIDLPVFVSGSTRGDNVPFMIADFFGYPEKSEE